MSERLPIHLEILPDKLPSRKCTRCSGIEFRAVVFSNATYVARCANCTFHGVPNPCGTIIDFVISDEGTTVTKCGEQFPLQARTLNGPIGLGDADSPSSIPLAVCLKCHKLVALQ